MISEYKAVNGELVKMSAEEISKRQAEVDEANSKLPEKKLNQIRELRNQKLSETDWYSNSDITMPDNIKTWRQQLRDLPQTYTTEDEYDELLEMQGDFPNQTLKHSIWSKP